jgi:glycosyltransferase involved in cell wall biosynthesis
MENLPRVSIVTVNFNGAAFLEKTILSVLDQKYSNLEYVIIDGGSTDGSIDIIKKYESRLHYWTTGPDKGMYDALQKGFEKTSGDIMGWLNADDLYYPNAIARSVEIFGDYPQVKWLTGAPTAIDEKDGVMVPRADEYPMWSKMRVYSGDYKWIQQESTLWRRDLWKKAGGFIDASLKLGGDFDLWLRFIKHEKLYSAPLLIGGFRIRRSGQLSVEGVELYETEARRCYKKNVPLFGFLLLPINLLDRLLLAIPVIRGIYYGTGFRKMLGYPPRMEFDAKSQKIVMR